MEVIYYFHPCAYVCAKWIPDTMLRQQMRLAEGIISATCAMYALEKVPLVCAEAQLGHPQTIWVLKSVEHFEWVSVYFQTIAEQYNRIYTTNLSFHNLMHIATAIGKNLPRVAWSDPDIDFPPDCIRGTVMESYRELFLATKVKPKSYNRVPRPYWVKERKGYAIDLG